MDMAKTSANTNIPPSPENAPFGGASTRVKHHARARFEKWALSYDRSRLNEFVFFPTVRVVLEEIAFWQSMGGVTAERPFRMLDVGCGTGTLLALVAENPLAEKLVGLDYAEEMVRRAAEKFTGSQNSAKLSAVRGDAERLPFPDESFDIVTCCNSFHHYPHQADAIRGFRRVLRPDGVLILVDGFRDNVIGWVVFDVAVSLIEGHVHHCAWSEIKQMINAAGFTSLRQRKKNVLAPLLINVASTGD